MEDAEFDRIFTSDKPVIFAYHGYPYLIHRLTYRRTNHDNIHVRGFIEEGTTTTPFDMTVSNKLDRYHLALEAIARIPGFAETVSEVIANLRARLDEHNAYVREHGEDLAEIRNWRWKRH
ncbi:phosphoketolase [Agrobacterium tumefaciens]|uniref:Phosphoketolase n=1 Tax=Agrobacterium radiobacter TaxID=362 RepID=A0ABR6JCD2_AGRRD|nr:phosphoketolase [Agrobacterium radiobacter]MBB4337162.1 phosphoketolase [Agrobacterium radiobacter]MBB4492590.1 phosphoketolase [Agrobacterium radiobacter]MBB4497488.1 phosphoketolase [Agrobacterium radiobacter]MBB4502601.1 phosphoketolase [Agrobacterium radiobacter]